MLIKNRWNMRRLEAGKCLYTDNTKGCEATGSAPSLLIVNNHKLCFIFSKQIFAISIPCYQCLLND